jgi:hypothetical protein
MTRINNDIIYICMISDWPVYLLATHLRALIGQRAGHQCLPGARRAVEKHPTRSRDVEMLWEKKSKWARALREKIENLIGRKMTVGANHREPNPRQPMSRVLF